METCKLDLPCPFCGELPEVIKHFKENEWRMIHNCSVMGSIILDWDNLETIKKRWNTRAIQNES